MKLLHRSATVVLFLAVACVLMVVGFRGWVDDVSSLYPLATQQNPYFVPAHFGLLYLAMPLGVIASLMLYLLPGCLLVLAFGRMESFEELILKGFGLTAIIHFGVLLLLHAVDRNPIPGDVFLVMWCIVLVLAWLLFAIRSRRPDLKSEAAAPLARLTPGEISGLINWRRLGWLIAASFALLVLLLPVLFWQDFNPDGLEIVTMGRSLASYSLPRLPTGHLSGVSLGIVASTYPVHWFVSVFGLTEAAGRLPLALFIPVLFAGVIGCAEWKMTRRLSAIELATLLLGLAVMVVTLVYSDSYHAYSADVSSPANIDLLVVLCMVAMTYFFWTRQRLWLLLFTAVGYMTRPTVLIFLFLLGAGVLLFSREQLREKLKLVVAALLLCVLLKLSYEVLFPAFTGAAIEQETESLKSRLRYLTFDDFRRFLFVLLPSGILPALSLFRLKTQDAMSRTTTLFILAYFSFFYVLAFTALHHFAPVMVLPLIVFWRQLLLKPAKRSTAALTATFALLALWISLPRSFSLDFTMRKLGEETCYRVGNYQGDYGEYREAFRHKNILYQLFRPHWQVKDPSQELIGSPWVQVHYASRQPMSSAINYVVQPLAESPPNGFTRVGEDESVGLYVRDLKKWRWERDHPPRTDFQSRAYDIPRTTLFGIWGVPERKYSLDLRKVFPGGDRSGSK